MVVLDATTLMFLVTPGAKAPADPNTNLPVEKAKARIEHLLKTLSEAKQRVLIPTPVLSEVLVGAGSAKHEVLATLTSTYAFQVEPFEGRAAVELAFLVDKDLQSGKRLSADETKAKVKFDRQIIAIAKVNRVTTIYSDDGGVYAVGKANGINVVRTFELPLPPLSDQPDMWGGFS